MENLNKQFKSLIDMMKLSSNKEIVFFCAGNYKIWYDDFAPLFAEELKKNNVKTFVYGGKDYSITASNIIEYMNFIENKHPNAFIIVVDNLLTFDKSQSGEVVIDKIKRIPAGLTSSRQFGNFFILFKVFPYKYDPNINIYKKFIIKCLIKYMNMYNFCNNKINFCKICN